MGMLSIRLCDTFQMCITRYDRTITSEFNFFVSIYIVFAFAHSPSALRHYVDCRPKCFIRKGYQYLSMVIFLIKDLD